MAIQMAVGDESFEEIRSAGLYYVDKTELLYDLLGHSRNKVTLFTRPRRFGKTLNMSMMESFFDITKDSRNLFEGLNILKHGDFCREWMNQYPVLLISFKDVDGLNFEEAKKMLSSVLARTFLKYADLAENSDVAPYDKERFQKILSETKEISILKNSLDTLMRMMNTVYGKPVILLIDEYDVPLAKASEKNTTENRYYEQMLDVIRGIMSISLKTNEYLKFAVITGCLRIAKEGIYTGLNNPEINTVLMSGKNDFFGFTEEEVRKLLTDSGVGDHFDQVREWYDGYRFGDSIIYNPWSVIKHIEALNRSLTSPPLAYWANTSGNAIIRELAERADEGTRAKIEQVMQGKEISFALRDNIVYNELYKKPDNVLNVMLSAGYLTATSFDGEIIQARIPNREVLKIYRDQISDWFGESVKTFDVRSLYHALEQGDSARAEQILTEEFMSAMSFYDTVEAFYHGVLLTLMQLNKNYLCTSNRESGSGRFDILAKQKTRWDLAFILEAKVSKAPSEMLSDARQGAKQIAEKEYCAELQREGYGKIMTYSISFCEKRCRVVQGETLTLPAE